MTRLGSIRNIHRNTHPKTQRFIPSQHYFERVS